MNWKLIITGSLIGTSLSVIAGFLIFFGSPQLANFNVEEYISGALFVIALVTAVITYRGAPTGKALHALIVFALVCGLTVAFSVVFILFLVLFVCEIGSPCRLFPFL